MACDCHKPSRCNCNGNTGCKSNVTKGPTSVYEKVTYNTCSCNTNVKAAVYKDVYECPSHRSTKDYSTGTSKAVSNGKVAPRPNTAFLSQTVADKITVPVITAIQTALNQELSIRSLSAGNWSSFEVTTKIDPQTIKKVKDAIDRCVAKDKANRYCICNTKGHSATVGTFGYNTPSTDTTVTWTNLNGGDITVAAKFYADIVKYFQKYTNVLQTKCICDCNYCTCNCDYCGCNTDIRPCSCNTEKLTCKSKMTSPRTCNCEGDKSVVKISCSSQCTCNTKACPSNVTCSCNCAYTSCTCKNVYSCTCQCNYSCTCNCAYTWCCARVDAC